MMIMWPPQQGHAGRRSTGSWSLSSSGGAAISSSARARARLGLRDELARRLGALDALQDSVADDDLGRYLARAVQTPLPELAEHFPERLYG